MSRCALGLQARRLDVGGLLNFVDEIVGVASSSSSRQNAAAAKQLLLTGAKVDVVVIFDFGLLGNDKPNG
ncbi:unnamed protein product, partial [Rotaria magnacalcarata]